MALNRKEVNSLNLLGFRKLNFIPSHFSKISLDEKIDIKELECWIEFNLNSRYGIQYKNQLNQSKKIIRVTEIGFEDPKELTIFNLGCHLIHKVKKEN